VTYSQYGNMIKVTCDAPKCRSYTTTVLRSGDTPLRAYKRLEDNAAGSGWVFHWRNDRCPKH
jgi:hypothetical protein